MTGELDWGLMSEPDRRGVVEPLRRKRVVGGTSWMTRFALRGSPADFAEWASLGNPGWTFDAVLPYFNRLESDVDFGDQPWHGDRGPMPVDRYAGLDSTEVIDAASKAMQALGFDEIEDHNRPGAVGVGRVPMTSREGERVSVADAYLPIADAPANLSIRPDVHVSHLVFDGPRARGVQLSDGTVIDAGWVVVSSGTFGSPSILMRSGIGPADHLRAVGIPVLLDLPGVGANLADHPGAGIELGYHGAARWAPILHSIATFRSAQASDSEPPDLMLWIADPVESRGEQPGFSIDVVLLKPRSRGTVRLRSVHPLDPPRVDLCDLEEASDVDRLAEGYLMAAEVARRAELRELCEPPALTSPAEVRAVIRADSFPVPHFVGTCSMGPVADPRAVVDEWGRVHGTERLSVIDASIMPTVPSGFTHLPTIMIAERLAEELRALV